MSYSPTAVDYFDKDDHEQTPGTRARASAINNALSDVDDSFALLPTNVQIKAGTINYGTDTGTADAHVVALPDAPTSYIDGMQVLFKAAGSNTGAPTINVNSLGVKSITRHDGTTPSAGDISVNKITELRYNQTSGNFEIQGHIGVVAGAGTMSVQNASAVNITGGSITGLTSQHLNGFLQRSKFTFNDVNTIKVGAGTYDVNGTVAKITSELTTAAHGLTGTSPIYLYISYSAIPSNGVIDASDFTWSDTAPTWSDTNLGYYNGNDRCIFGVMMDTNAILEFWHNGDRDVVQGVGVDIHDNADVLSSTWLNIVVGAPAFVGKARVYIRYVHSNQYTEVFWRKDGAVAAGCPIGTLVAGATEINATIDVLLDPSNQQFEMKETTSSTNTLTVTTLGWFLPQGM